MRSNSVFFVIFTVACLLGFAPVMAAENAAATVRVDLLDMTAQARHGGPGAAGNRPGTAMGRHGMGAGGMTGAGKMSIVADRTSVKAGLIHFVVTNRSAALEHEMLVVAIDKPGTHLPYDPGSARVPEDQIKSMGEVEELKPKTSGSLDVTLKPGAYLLICNLAGHFVAGMTMPFTVTP